MLFRLMLPHSIAMAPPVRKERALISDAGMTVMEIDRHRMVKDVGDAIGLDRHLPVVLIEEYNGCIELQLVQMVILDSPNGSSAGEA
jgi:hypothetical protein